MPTPSNTGSDFARALSAAQERPESDINGREPSSGFPPYSANPRNIVDLDKDPGAIDGVTRYSAKVHRKVYTIWKDWRGCSQCKDAIAGNAISLPDVGTYECPHTNCGEYEGVMNEILAGRLVLGSEQETVLARDGTVLVSLRWFSRILSKKEKRILAKEKALAGE